ncbi:hypothetical protein CISIN_1g039630mg, partial [Citrus sinensis]
MHGHSQYSIINYSRKVQGYKFSKISYNELKIATNGFRTSNKIGEGGFGSVYKGRLEDGTVVAVNVLSVESKQGETEFMSEVASMANINICHENLVKLHGGCIDGPSRILAPLQASIEALFLFTKLWKMDKFISIYVVSGSKKNRVKFNWIARREIALGIARGLAYIHEEIKTTY